MATKLLLDENLSERLVPLLAAQFSDVAHVRLRGLGGAPDGLLWELAISEERVLVTKDVDFVKWSVLRGTPPKILWLDVGNSSNTELADVLLRRVADIERFVRDPDLGFLALTR